MSEVCKSVLRVLNLETCRDVSTLDTGRDRNADKSGTCRSMWTRGCCIMRVIVATCARVGVWSSCGVPVRFSLAISSFPDPDSDPPEPCVQPAWGWPRNFRSADKARLLRDPPIFPNSVDLGVFATLQLRLFGSTCSRDGTIWIHTT
jgi:hypothetical protein